MALHDAYARLTPFELALPDAGASRARLQAIATEAAAQGIDPGDPTTLLRLAPAVDALRRMRPESEVPGGVHSYAALLFHAYHFQRCGGTLYLLTAPVARYLVDTDPDLDGWAPHPPCAGYVQLPRHLFWVRPLADGPAEAVDGLSWVTPGDGTLSMLVAMGMREGRPGLSVVSLEGLPLADAALWARARARPRGADFASSLPGGELDRLYSLETAGEVLKLLARSFWYVERFPASVVEREPWATATGGGRPAGAMDPARGGTGARDASRPATGIPRPAPSTLPYTEVRLS